MIRSLKERNLALWENDGDVGYNSNQAEKEAFLRGSHLGLKDEKEPLRKEEGGSLNGVVRWKEAWPARVSEGRPVWVQHVKGREKATESQE